MNTLTIEQQKQAIANMKEELAKLEANLIESEKKASRVYGVAVETGRAYYRPLIEPDGTYTTMRCNSAPQEESFYKGIYFDNKTTCDNWCDAHNVMNELRLCEGVKAFEREEENHTFSLFSGSLSYNTYGLTCGTGLVYFTSEEAAKAAVEKVGKERVVNAIKVLAGQKLG